MWFARWTAIVMGIVAVLSAIAAGLLWLNAKPSLEAATTSKAALAVCPSAKALPVGYPRAPIEIQNDDGAEQAAWRLACRRLGANACPRTIATEVRYVGFRLYLPGYLSACQLKALSLRPEAPLGGALSRIYPNGVPSELSREAALCVRRTAVRSPGAPPPAICEGL